MTYQLDMFAPEPCTNCGCTNEHLCWRCGGSVDCKVDKFHGAKMSSGWPREWQSRQQRCNTGFECFDCNHAVAIAQIAVAYGRSIEQVLQELTRRTVKP